MARPTSKPFPIEADTRSPAKSLGPRAVRTRTLIMDTARESSLRKGYGGTTVDDIVEAAGISRGSFYTYFPSKRDVLLAVGEFAYDAARVRAERFADIGTEWSLADVETWVADYLDCLDQAGAFMLAWNQEPNQTTGLYNGPNLFARAQNSGVSASGNATYAADPRTGPGISELAFAFPSLKAARDFLQATADAAKVCSTFEVPGTIAGSTVTITVSALSFPKLTDDVHAHPAFTRDAVRTPRAIGQTRGAVIRLAMAANSDGRCQKGAGDGGGVVSPACPVIFEPICEATSLPFIPTTTRIGRSSRDATDARPFVAVRVGTRRTLRTHLHDLRRHQRDPAAGHRTRDLWPAYSLTVVARATAGLREPHREDRSRSDRRDERCLRRLRRCGAVARPDAQDRRRGSRSTPRPSRRSWSCGLCASGSRRTCSPTLLLLHDLRHRSATMAIAGGNDVHTVAGRRRACEHGDDVAGLRARLEAADRALATALGDALDNVDDPSPHDELAVGQSGGMDVLGRLGADRQAIAEFCRRSRIRRLAVFGSGLRDDFTPESDVDLLVEFEPGQKVSLFDMARMEMELEEIIRDHPVDLRTAGDLSHRFRERVIAEAEPVYDAAA